jgi:hypothetical protein
MVWAKRVHTPITVRSERGDLSGQSGDYLVTDGASEWPVRASIFEQSYEWVNGDRVTRASGALERRGFRRARKVAPTWVKQIAEATVVQTLEGPRSAQPGDWLAIGIDGETWPIDRESFEADYEPADPPPA